MLYLDEETLEWAKLGIEDEDAIKHIDSNGNILQNGDNVVLIKDLNVKGGGFTAKRGTAVRGIRLDPNNAEFIEGRVDGQQIVIITQYVKKS
jgi:protein PhnA